MSLHEYHQSMEITGKNYAFYALIMAAMRQADDENAGRLKLAFPWVWDELEKRYNAGGGVLDVDLNKDGPDQPKLTVVSFDCPASGSDTGERGGPDDGGGE